MEDDFVTELPNNSTLQGQLQYHSFDQQFEIESKNLKIMKMLGHGYFGDVFLGILTTKDHAKLLVAVKTPKKRDPNSQVDLEYEKILQQQRKSLRDELKIMCFIGYHENALKLIGAVTTSRDNFCVITEYCELGSLDIFLRTKFEKDLFCDEIVEITKNESNDMATDKTLWKAQKDNNWSKDFNQRRSNGQITTSDLLWFALQIARAMDFMTKNRVLHRDVALRNVLLKADFVVKVADFGLSRQVNNDGTYCAVNHLVLPFRYISPESLSTGRFSSESECWAYGVVVWELFSFAVNQPYETECEKSDDYEIILTYLRSGRRLIIPDCAPLSMRNLMNQLWNVEPSERPTFETCANVIINELLQTCPEILDKPPVAATLPNSQDVPVTISRSQMIKKFSLRNAKLLSCIAGIFVVLILVAIGLVLTRLFIFPDAEMRTSGKDFVRHFRGVPGAIFSVHPDGNSIFTFDGINFKHINLTTEKYSVLENNDAVKLQESGRHVRSNSMHAIVRHSKTFILLLFVDFETTKFSLATFLINETHAIIIDEQELGINQTTYYTAFNFALAHSIVQDNITGQLYCLLYWDGSYVSNPNFAQTFFSAAQIDINDKGRISAEVCPTRRFWLAAGCTLLYFLGHFIFSMLSR